MMMMTLGAWNSELQINFLPFAFVLKFTCILKFYIARPKTNNAVCQNQKKVCPFIHEKYIFLPGK